MRCRGERLRDPPPLRVIALQPDRCLLLRAQEISADLIELLIQISHRIGEMAERRIERELIAFVRPGLFPSR